MEKRIIYKGNFIENAKKKYGNKYNYDLVEYINNKIKVKIICPKISKNGKVHGEFSQRPKDHLQGKGCPKCNYSKGEEKCKDILNKLNIKFTPQKKIKDMKHKNQLSFDFYFELNDQKYAIEYNGEQHYKVIKIFGSEKYKVTIIRDNIKRKYCKKNNIKLLSIPYFMFSQCEELIKILINKEKIEEFNKIQLFENIYRQFYMLEYKISILNKNIEKIKKSISLISS